MYPEFMSGALRSHKQTTFSRGAYITAPQTPGASEQVRLARLKPEQYLARFIFKNQKFRFPHIAVLIRGSEKPDQSVTASDAPEPPAAIWLAVLASPHQKCTHPPPPPQQRDQPTALLGVFRHGPLNMRQIATGSGFDNSGVIFVLYVF